MTQHTPGPWSAIEVLGYAIEIEDREGHSVAAVSERASAREMLANGRMLCAAPRLLSALRGMCEMVVHHTMPEDEKRSILREARLAIKEAEGHD